ncbi:hypothetical protein BDB01DRAFT_778265 [Pilobolus umbonatus]|nr:hypothetical protein BDB01DRAFT_778265 [Pilobolus umbonatus]
MTSPDTQLNNWLSLSDDISIDDTFSKDLLRQFDRKRSKLHVELGLSEEQMTSTSTLNITPPTPSHSSLHEMTPVRLDDIEDEEESYVSRNNSIRTATTTDTGTRRRSAGDLLRRSSAFLRTKFDQLKKNGTKSHDNLRKDMPPTKVIMKTTIQLNNNSYQPSTSSRSVSSSLMRPPTITQYPPKPLVYSPVEPIGDEPIKPLLHRISMPLMRKSPTNVPPLTDHQRRKSDIDSIKRMFIKKKGRK